MKKSLRNKILLSLVASTVMPSTIAFASSTIEGNEQDGLKLTTTDTIYSPDQRYGGPFSGTSWGRHGLKDFNEIHINFTPSGPMQRGLMINGEQFDLSKTDLHIDVNENGTGTDTNTDGIHMTGKSPSLTLKNYTAHIYTPKSDALNLSHDVCGDATATINKLDATVEDGHGIRANASRYTDNGLNKIIINDSANIITKGDNSAAAYAGDSQYSVNINMKDIEFDKIIKIPPMFPPFGCGTVIDVDKIVENLPDNWTTQSRGDLTKGQGQIFLKGDTTIKNYGDNSYGIYAGRNGNIEVNNLDIISKGEGGYGVIAKDSNLIYPDVTNYDDLPKEIKDRLLSTAREFLKNNRLSIYFTDKELEGYLKQYVDNGHLNLDNSENKFGSTVVLNGDTNDITMGEGGRALYADSKYGKIVSGKFIDKDNIEEGNIGSLNATGLVEADHEGTIDLNTVVRTAEDGTYNTTGTVAINSVNNVQDKNNNVFGSDVVVLSHNKATINFETQKDNNINGALKAIDNGKIAFTSSEGSNTIYSNANISDDADESVISAVYAKGTSDGANSTINITGNNYIGTYVNLEQNTLDSTNSKTNERTVWAQQGGKINIDGQTTIVASNVNKNTDTIDQNGQDTGIEQDGNSLGIAITAGTGKVADLGIIDTDIADENRSTVNLTNASGSSITGDIVSGYGGLINIGMDVNNKTRDAGTVENITITGNALAANGGKLNINLGNNGTWTGRADDYGDAGYGTEAQNHQNFYNPAFSNEIQEGGTVNLTMGDNSTWNVDGQSWITSVTATGNATIDLVSAKNDKNTTAHALTIGTLSGNANVNMSLDGDRSVSDMLYVKEAQGTYNVTLADPVTTKDLYSDDVGNRFNGLRFATVGEGSNVTFNVSAKDAGAFNVEYVVGTDDYDTSTENETYNGTTFDGEQGKVGDTAVDEFFATSENTNTETTPNESENGSTNQIALLAVGPTSETTETTKETATTKATATNATNYKLTAVKNESISNENLSDAGKTILNMGKANYSQAVYMDTLSKRLGEERYLEGDEGLWVRMRHDKIDKDNSYEITNNMYELGYDKKYESKDKKGYHRKGAALDYMDGDTSYDDIAGSGETDRKGIWLYDTWFGNKGHYTDFVAKWGHLENSFDLYTKTRGEKVSGEYNNDVYSLSAEWGYKDPLKNGWYFEPQTQLQYARVTGADYETSQGTQVSVDGIDSLIARAGFRLGKDFGEEKKSTFYVKADILHEFLGDQDITVMDKTTDGKAVSIGYDNDGTWYSVGLGFSTMLSDSSYAFLDVEKLFGNDNDNSYQINGGFNWLL